MRSRLFSPLRIVILLFAGAAALIVVVAVYQARRGPLMQQEKARVEEVRRVLSTAARGASEQPESEPPAGGAAPAPRSWESVMVSFHDAYRRFPAQAWDELARRPESFPAGWIESLERERESGKGWVADRSDWLKRYDSGEMAKQSNWHYLVESNARVEVQGQLDEAEKELKETEARIEQAQNRPDELWKELDDYLSNLEPLHYMDTKLRESREVDIPANAAPLTLFESRVVVDARMGRASDALRDYATVCLCLERTLYTSRDTEPAGGLNSEISRNFDIAVGADIAQYIVEHVDLNRQQGDALITMLGECASKPRLMNALLVSGAFVEQGLDQEEIAALHEKYGADRRFRSPFEIAKALTGADDSSPVDMARLLDGFETDLRQIQRVPYSTSSSSLFGPQGKLSTYVRYAFANEGETQTAHAATNRPVATTTLEFVAFAKRAVDSYQTVARPSDVFRVIVALNVYRAAHGAYPERLEQLVPDFLEKIPALRWKGKPIIYTAPDPRTGRGYVLGPGPDVNREASDALRSGGE